MTVGSRGRGGLLPHLLASEARVGAPIEQAAEEVLELLHGTLVLVQKLRHHVLQRHVDKLGRVPEGQAARCELVQHDAKTLEYLESQVYLRKNLMMATAPELKHLRALTKLNHIPATHVLHLADELLDLTPDEMKLLNKGLPINFFLILFTSGTL